MGPPTLPSRIHRRAHRDRHLLQPHLPPLHHLRHILRSSYSMVSALEEDVFGPRHAVAFGIECGRTDGFRVVGLGTDCFGGFIVRRTPFPFKFIDANKKK